MMYNLILDEEDRDSLSFSGLTTSHIVGVELNYGRRILFFKDSSNQSMLSFGDTDKRVNILHNFNGWNGVKCHLQDLHKKIVGKYVFSDMAEACTWKLNATI